MINKKTNLVKSYNTNGILTANEDNDEKITEKS